MKFAKPVPKVVSASPVTVDISPERGRLERNEQAEQDADEGVRVRGVFFILEDGGESGESPEVHDAGHAQIQVAGFFRQDLAEGTVHEDGAELDRTDQPRQQVFLDHDSRPPFLPPRRKMSLY